jgi:hypothetical protein
MGANATEMAIKFVREQSPDFEIAEKPPKRG